MEATCRPDHSTLDTGGRYRRYRSLIDAVERVDLLSFEGDTPLFRSFPPEDWPQASSR